MEFQDEHLQAAGLTQEQLQQLSQMSIGGHTGASGYRYQMRYAVCRMIEAAAYAAEHKSLTLFGVMEQGRCFVDDVLINIDDDYFIFCQLKTSDRETWTRDSSKLTKEFQAQLKLNKAADLPKGSFELILVTPHQSRVNNLMGANKSKIPRGLKYCTTVEHFPHVVGTFSKFLQEHQPTITHLSALCAIEPTSDVRAQIFAAFDSAWQDLSTPGEYCLLDLVLERLYQQPELPILGHNAKPPSRWPRAQAILQQIPDLEVELVHGFCQYSHRYTKGFIPSRCDQWGFGQFLERVIATPPQDFSSFMQMVSG